MRIATSGSSGRDVLEERLVAELPKLSFRHERREMAGGPGIVGLTACQLARHLPGPRESKPSMSGIYYQVRIVGGELRPEPGGRTCESAWVPVSAVDQMVRASIVDVGLALARGRPATGHVEPVEVTGLLRH